MKIFYLIVAIFIVNLTGCSSTYKLTDFSSKEKFIADFNKTSRDHTIEVILKNDSSFSVTGDATALNDTLLFSSQKSNINFEKLPIGQIKMIRFNSHIGGIKYGFISFVVPGLFLGLAVSLTTETNLSDNTTIIYTLPIISGALGGIIGYIFGHNYIYQFNL
jgi:hypothetical protein